MCPRKSMRLAGTRSETGGDDQGQIPLPVPENWQQIMVNMQARLQSQEEQICLLRQHVPLGSAASIVPPAVAPVVQPLEVGE